PLGARRRSIPADTGKKIFTAVWMAPALCFFTFIFLKFVNSGYLLLVAVPACVWLGEWTAAWYESDGWPKWLKNALMAACVVANISIFLVFPAYCSYRSV